MLAKAWKKVLLAICILACIYNVMHKLVGRTSLEYQLKSVQNQNSIIDMLDTNQPQTKPSETEKPTNSVNSGTNVNKTKNNSIVVIY